jgi:hypothetical protein
MVADGERDDPYPREADMRLWIVVCAGLLLFGCDEPGAVDRTAQDVKLNETLAVSHLRALVGAQVHAKSLCMLDVDGDGEGEYGFLSELSGGATPRGSGAGLKLNLLGGGFEGADGSGPATVDGYRYRVFLPGTGDEVVGEERDAGARVASDGAEAHWACYAWPEIYGSTGQRTFFVNQDGEVREIDEPSYNGKDGPDAAAAFAKGSGLAGDPDPAWQVVE